MILRFPTNICGAALVVASFVTVPASGQAPVGISSVSSQVLDVTIGVPARRKPEAEAQLLAGLVADCRRVIPISEADSAALVSRVQPSGASESTPNDGFIEITVQPRAGLTHYCGTAAGSAALLSAIGAWVAADSLLPPSRTIASVSVRRGGSVARPLSTERGEVFQLSATGRRTTAAEYVRLRVPLEALMSHADDARADLTIDVVTDNASAPQSVVVSWSVLREMFDQLMPLRAARVGTVNSPVIFETASSAVLRDAQQALRNGNGQLAAQLAVQEVLRNQLSASDWRYARAQNAMIFAEFGDEFAARLNIEYLLEAEPCFDWDAAAPASVRDLTQALRLPDERCHGIPLGTVLWQSALIPGFGRALESPRENRSRVKASVWVVGSLAIGGYFSSVARDRYRKYLAAEPVYTNANFPQPRIVEMYQDAELARGRGETLVIIGVAVWSANAAWQVWQEHRYTRRVNAVRSFGQARATSDRSIRIVPAPRGLGAGMEIVW